ncbi:hypothetical protein NMY22_g13189 [Coprinellus aureogranulatus]|nr:hypothetical protein NMY22_g13189 [Coprinellus aureogranulatus]
MHTHSEESLPQVELPSEVQPRDTRAESTMSPAGEVSRTSSVNQRTQPQHPHDRTSTEAHGTREPSSTTPPSTPRKPPGGSPLKRRQERIGNPGIVNIWEDAGRIDITALQARQKARVAQVGKVAQLPQPLVGPTGTFIEPEEKQSAGSYHREQARVGDASQNLPQAPETARLGPNGTHLIDQDEAWLGPNGTHLIKEV